MTAQTPGFYRISPSIQELSTPIIPVMDRIIVMPLIGSIDTMRARDIMRTLLGGIRENRAKVVIMDITGVPLADLRTGLLVALGSLGLKLHKA